MSSEAELFISVPASAKSEPKVKPVKIKVEGLPNEFCLHVFPHAMTLEAEGWARGSGCACRVTRQHHMITA